MTQKNSENIPKPESALLADSRGLYDMLLDLGQKVHDVRRSGKSITSEEFSMLRDLRMALELVEDEAGSQLEPTRADIQERVHEVLETIPLTQGQSAPEEPISSSTPISQEVLEGLRPSVKMIEEKLRNTSEAVQNIVEVQGLPDSPCSPANKQKMLQISNSLIRDAGVLMPFLQGAEVENDGAGPREQLSIVLQHLLRTAYTLLSTLRGQHEGKWVNDGVMNTAGGRAAAENTAETIMLLHSMLFEVDPSTREMDDIGSMVATAKQVAFAVWEQSRQQVLRHGAKAPEWSGSAAQRRRKAI